MSDAEPVQIIVLLVENEPADVRLVREAFRSVNNAAQLHVAADGMEAMAFLRREGEHIAAPRPDLILLDLNMPRMNGHEVLAQIKQDKGLRKIPTLVLTALEAESNVSLSYALQANCHLRKPGHLDAFFDLVKAIDAHWLSEDKLPRQGATAREATIAADRPLP